MAGEDPVAELVRVQSSTRLNSHEFSYKARTMPINYFPNDPLAATVPLRVVAMPRPDRPANRAGLNFSNIHPEDRYAVGTPGFLYWQCREAALRTLDLFEDLIGASFDSWFTGQNLDLFQDHGVDVNAYYDRFSLAFFHSPDVGQVFHSGASADVVAHEAGHGLLDALRDDFWLSGLFEVNAIHEAFGDCVAILTALYDRDTRVAILANVAGANDVESLLEYLAAAIAAAIDPNHNAAAARRGRNNYQWQLPSSLPAFGSPEDGPGVLINEEHSFGQVFTGCFYDTIANIFANTGGTEADLRTTARTAGRLLLEGITQAPQTPRFFAEVGRAMVLADDARNAGANRDAIKAAFEGHGIVLGVGSRLAPTAALAGAAPNVAAATLPASVKKDLLARIGAAGAKLTVTALQLGKEVVTQAIHERLVPLDGLHKKLKGVVLPAVETALVGDSGGRSAVLGSLPDPATTTDEVRNFVGSLLVRGAILFDEVKATRKAVAAATAPADEVPPPITHALRTVKGQPTLVRLRFACSCHGRPQRLEKARRTNRSRPASSRSMACVAPAGTA